MEKVEMILKSSLSILASYILLITFSNASNAALVSRLGGQAVYDTDLNITWLVDGNASTGSAFDDGSLSNDGRMTWASANAWAASLSIGGKSGWRLPSALSAFDGSICTGYNCTNSEMGHLFYSELSGTSGETILNSTDPNLAFFTNIDTGFWLETGFNSTLAYAFFFGNVNSGIQTFGGMGSNLSALAVYDGDISAVPVPAAIWLFVSGFLGLFGVAKRKF